DELQIDVMSGWQRMPDPNALPRYIELIRDQSCERGLDALPHLRARHGDGDDPVRVDLHVGIEWMLTGLEISRERVGARPIGDHESSAGDDGGAEQEFAPVHCRSPPTLRTSLQAVFTALRMRT